jgi:hypothetical protein
VPAGRAKTWSGQSARPRGIADGGTGATWASTITANPADPDVLIAALQDNGLVYRPGASRHWVSMIGGDGRRATFVAPDVALVVVNDATDVHVATWDGATITRGAQLVPAGEAPNSFFPLVRRVCHPAYRRGGDLMVAVASDDSQETGKPTGKRVFGLFDTATGPAGIRFRWEQLATMPFDVTGIGSWDGRSLVVATLGAAPPKGVKMSGHIYLLDSATGAVTELATGALAGRGGARWVDFLGAGSAVALDDVGVVHTPDLVTWRVSGAGAVAPVSTGASCLVVDRFPLPAVTYIGREDGVFGCTDLTGATWEKAANLPAVPRVSNADLVAAGGKRHLHVGTWNWSAWRAELR